MENAAGPHIELPDEGMSEAELNATTDAVKRRALRQEAHRQGRYTVGGGISPKTTNGNLQGGQGRSNGGGNGAGGTGTGGALGSSARLPPPVFSDVAGAVAGSGATDIVYVTWLPETRNDAELRCGGLLAERTTRLFLLGEALAVVALPDPDRRKLALQRLVEHNADHNGEEQQEEKKGHKRKRPAVYIPDPVLRRARAVNAKQLRQQGNEAKIVFRAKAAGKPRRDGQVNLTSIHPPLDAYEDLVDNPAMVPVPRILAVSRLPWMDQDGGLDMTVGYNPNTEVWQDIDYLGALNIPAKPTEDDVRAAVAMIFSPFQHYEHRDRKVLLGQVLTMAISAIERPFLKTCPAFIVIGHSPGVGKGRMCKAIIFLGCGSDGDMITAGESPEEFDKRYDSAIMDNPVALIVDNYNGMAFGNYQIDSLLTEGRAKIRVYGRKGRDVIVDARMLLCVNGNNMWVRGDTARRCIVVDLETDSEFPAKRKFPFFPDDEVRRTRHAMIEACYTCMRWWRQRHMEGRGATVTPLGSFEDWSVRVGDLVQELTSSVMCGEEDGTYEDGWHPTVTIETLAEQEVERVAMARALAAVEARFGLNRPLRSTAIAQICACVEKSRRDGFSYLVGLQDLDLDIHPALVAAKQSLGVVATALYAGDKTGVWAAPKADLDMAHELLVAQKNAAESAAQRLQAELELDLEEAIAEVTSGGRTSGRAIGGFFRRASGRRLDGRRLVFDAMSSGADARNVRIVTM